MKNRPPAALQMEAWRNRCERALRTANCPKMSVMKWSSSSFSPFSERVPILAGICTAAKRISFRLFSLGNRKENRQILWTKVAEISCRWFAFGRPMGSGGVESDWISIRNALKWWDGFFSYFCHCFWNNYDENLIVQYPPFFTGENWQNHFLRCRHQCYSWTCMSKFDRIAE